MIKRRALVLFSGGLDSMLAVKVLLAQGIEVEAIAFESVFFSASKASESAELLGINLNIVNVDDKILELVKNPIHGHGKHLNPCLDCRSMMIRRAGGYLNKNINTASEIRFDFLASGEVLGQRPFSQNKMALHRMRKISGLEVLRPLSAKLLPETEIEKNGLVKRELLLDLSGRGRDRQILLAREYGIEKYPTPGGGCLLTETDFSQRLHAMLINWSDCNSEDARLLKYGRPYWLLYANEHDEEKRVLAVVGRSKEDNEELRKLAKVDDFMVELKDHKGPLCILRGKGCFENFAEELDFSNFEIDVEKKIDIVKLMQKKAISQIFESASKLMAYHFPRVRGKKARIIFFKVK